jgi:2-amino-4-hydroxy-6-hydroxymethyldihydropteridine diphosphokinase
MGLQPGDELRYPPHLNCVAKIRTNLPPEELLTVIQSVEDAGARQRTERWGPRTIDMDILLYGHETRDTEILTIPHPGLTERAFVVIPLLDIAPELILPDGVPLRDVVAQDTIQRQPLKRVEDDELLL